MHKLVVGLLRFLPLYALLLVLTSLMRPDRAFAQLSKVTINATQGTPGTIVTGTGTIEANLGHPGDRIQVTWDDTNKTVLANTTAHSNNTFSVSFNIPSNATAGAHSIYFIDLDVGTGYVLDSPTLTVVAQQAGCADAYFIGVHGTAEGPDGPNQILSQVIGETWENFYSLATKSGKNVKGYAIDYPAPIWRVLLTTPFPGSVVDVGASKLEGLVFKIGESCLTPNIVLAGYSLGAWVINQWLAKISAPPAPVYTLLNSIKAVELYGDPLWNRSGDDHQGKSYVYNGVARTLPIPGLSNPYTNNPQGPSVEIADRWQSRCLKGDPVCGEGYMQNPAQVPDVLACANTICEHKKYTKANGGYNLTERGANYLYLKVFPPVTDHPQVMHHETFREGGLVFFRLFFTNPNNNEATGFGFAGTGWAQENHPFTSPSYGRVHLEQPSVEYPFNHACGTPSAYESDVAAWINYISKGFPDESNPVLMHMICTAPCEVVTPYSIFTWDDVSSSPQACGDVIAR